MKGDARVVARLRAIDPARIAIPQPALAEIAYGIARLPPSRRRAAFAGQLERVRGAVQRLAWADDVTTRFGDIKAQLERAGERIEDFDAAIAAHALSLDATLVSSNVRHMTRIPGLRVEDWTR